MSIWSVLFHTDSLQQLLHNLHKLGIQTVVAYGHGSVAIYTARDAICQAKYHATVHVHTFLHSTVYYCN